jgi:hypothetical protein
VRPEAVFVAGYATALLAGAVALHRLGRADRSLAHRFQDRRDRDGTETATDDRDSDWPHSEVPRFYTGIALVAAGASTLLSAGELLARDHRTPETALLIIVFVLAVLTVGWLRAKIHQRPKSKPSFTMGEPRSARPRPP